MSDDIKYDGGYIFDESKNKNDSHEINDEKCPKCGSILMKIRNLDLMGNYEIINICENCSIAYRLK